MDIWTVMVYVGCGGLVVALVIVAVGFFFGWWEDKE